MTEKQSQQLERKALRLIGQPGSIMVGVTVSPEKADGAVRGHTIYLPASFPVRPEPTGDYQWMGIHRCMCITIRRPIQWTSLLRVAKDLPTIEPFGFVTWMGNIHQKKSHIPEDAIMFYIRQVLWNPPEPVHFRTKGIIHPIPVGKGGFMVYILEIPAIQREKVVPDYIEEL